MTGKKIITVIMLLLAIALMIYGYWGAFTSAGNKVYDEMDGFLPFFLLIGGVILFFTACILHLFIRRKVRK